MLYGRKTICSNPADAEQPAYNMELRGKKNTNENGLCSSLIF